MSKSILLRETIKLIEDFIEDAEVWHLDDVRVGLLYTGVKISEYGGVAYTFLEDIFSDLHSDFCPYVGESLRGMQLSEALHLALSWNIIEAAIGVASLNAISQYLLKKGDYRFTNMDVVDLINRGDKVVMVGDFKPLIPKIRKKTEKLVIIEKTLSPRGANLLPYFAVEDALPEADVVIATGSTLVNKSIDRLLELGSSARHFVLLGPTASIVPDVFFERGGTAVMGIQVTNVDEMLRVVSEVGGTRRLLRSCAKKFQIISPVSTMESR